ncbi:MAG: hypothetical protein MAG451_02620 [Anaerolineales bacterium]|nr:hypothetical protein [Anaerolineales bacterium]
MSRFIRLNLVILILVGSLLAYPAPATYGGSNCEPDGRQASGALYRICMPERGAWNRDLVIYAHGYVAFDDPLEIPREAALLSKIVNRLGFAFATTSYSTNGLAVRQGVADVRDLVDIFRTEHGQPRRVYLVGPSEGGTITVLAVEQFPEAFDGALALCGPVGDLQRQINYWGDFRVLFDYFFPDLIPGSPVNIPQEVMDNWDTVYVPRIHTAIWSNLHATEQLLRVARAPIDRGDPASVDVTILGLLWYNVFATNDGIAKLGGQPFNNVDRIYRGSGDDARLNREVQRIQADAGALAELEAHYQTSGQLTTPLVTLHTTGDPIVPYWHEFLYRAKVVETSATSQHTNIPVVRYGHCNFKLVEMLVSFGLLVSQVTGQELTGIEDALLDVGVDLEADFVPAAPRYDAPR